jgi:electron transfer flavoprotein alpha subunit
MSVLVWIEQSKGVAVASSWEVLGQGRVLANGLGTKLVAAVIGDDTAKSAEAARTYGADTVLTLTGPALADYRLSAYAAALKKAVAEAGATVVLAAATTRGREVTATVACDLGTGLAPDAVDLRVDGGKLVAVRSVYSNNILTDVTYSSTVQVASVRPRSFPMPEAGAAGGELKAVDPGINDADVKEKVI